MLPRDPSPKLATVLKQLRAARNELTLLHYEQYMLSIGLVLDSNNLRVPCYVLGEKFEKKLCSLKEKLAALDNAVLEEIGSQT